MKQYKLTGLLLFFFSQVSWAGLIELKGSGLTQSSATAPSISFVSSFIVDTNVLDSNLDPTKGLFLNALKGGSLTFNSGRHFNLDLTVPGSSNVETQAVANSGSFAAGALRLFLNFVDDLGEMLNISYFCHTEFVADSEGFVGAGTSLKGLEGDVSFESTGELCLSNCGSAVMAYSVINTVPAPEPVATVPEPQSILLLLSGLAGMIFVRRLKLRS